MAAAYPNERRNPAKNRRLAAWCLVGHCLRQRRGRPWNARGVIENSARGLAQQRLSKPRAPTFPRFEPHPTSHRFENGRHAGAGKRKPAKKKALAMIATSPTAAVLARTRHRREAAVITPHEVEKWRGGRR